MGDVLRNLNPVEIETFRRLAVSEDFARFRAVLIDSLDILRENSDVLLDDKLTFVSKGRRQSLKEIIHLTDKENISAISEKVRRRH